MLCEGACMYLCMNISVLLYSCDCQGKPYIYSFSAMVPRMRTRGDASICQLPSVADGESYVPLGAAMKPLPLLRRACKSGHAPRMTEVAPLVAKARQARKRHSNAVLSNSSEGLQHICEDDSPAVCADGVSGGLSPTLKGLASIPLGDAFFEEVPNDPKCIVRRQCFRPMWSLIGTFKCDLYSLVDADFHNDMLKWYQQTPNGDFQQMRVPLSCVKEVSVVSPAAKEAGAHWVVIRTSTRPSQIVFGFEKLADARRMKSTL